MSFYNPRNGSISQHKEMFKEYIAKVKQAIWFLHTPLFFFFKFYFIFKLYKIVLVMPNIIMNPPQNVCMCMLSQSCPTLCDPMDCSPPDSSVHGIFQARILEWVAISSSRGSSQSKDRTHISCVSYTVRWILYHWATWGTLCIESYVLIYFSPFLLH